jgi:hypothetical protein
LNIAASLPVGAALEIFLPENQKNTLGFQVHKKIETKKRASRANRTTPNNPKIAYFLILTMATKIHAGVHITLCCHRTLPALAT